MKDRNGNILRVGDKLRSIQSPPGCGIVICTNIGENIADFRFEDGRYIDIETSTRQFKLTQESLTNSQWVIETGAVNGKTIH